MTWRELHKLLVFSRVTARPKRRLLWWLSTTISSLTERADDAWCLREQVREVWRCVQDR